MVDTPLVGRFGEIATVADVRISPDGQEIAYTVVDVDVEADTRPRHIWLIQASGDAEPRRFDTASPNGHLPRWSPDGTKLAFACELGGPTWQISVAPASGGDARVVATSPEGIEDLEWSPDGTMLAYTARQRDAASYRNGQTLAITVKRVRSTLDGSGFLSHRRRHVFVVAADGATAARQLTFGDNDDEHVAWSPDSTRIAFVSDRGDQYRDLQYSTDIFTVGAAGGDPVQITPTGKLYGSPAWHPDGRIACITTPDPTHAHRHAQVAVMDANGSNEIILSTSLDRNASGRGGGTHGAGGRAFCWQGGSILFLIQDHGGFHLYSVEARDGAIPQAVITGERHVRAFDVVGNTLAAVIADATHPSGLTVITDGAERQVTDFAAHLARQQPTSFLADNGEGGKVQAWILPPAGLQPGMRYPTILHVHGGPNYMDGWRYSPEKQTLAAAGYAVIYSNPRGSTGYPESWARAVRGRKATSDPGGGFGDPAFTDLMAVVDEAARQFDFVDPDRLAITGTSYGGFMTVWSLGCTDRFKAGMSVNASTNLSSLLWRGDWIVPWLSGQLGVDVLTDTQAVWDISPISKVRNIHAPLLLLHAEEDKGCTIEQSEQVFHTLRFLKRPVEMVRFPRASHVVAAPQQLRERLRRTLDWFERYLVNPATPTE